MHRVERPCAVVKTNPTPERKGGTAGLLQRRATKGLGVHVAFSGGAFLAVAAQTFVNGCPCELIIEDYFPKHLSFEIDTHEATRQLCAARALALYKYASGSLFYCPAPPVQSAMCTRCRCNSVLGKLHTNYTASSLITESVTHESLLLDVALDFLVHHVRYRNCW